VSAAAERAISRKRNRRGEGERLREDLIAAAVEMVEATGAESMSLRGIARHVGIAATSVYLHFPDLDHLLAGVVDRGFEELTVVTTAATEAVADPAEALRARCRAYSHFGISRSHLYRVMFQANLPITTIGDNPAGTPGRKSFQNLVVTVDRCLQSGVAPSHDDSFRLASLIWTAEHGIVLTRLSRPTFPWAPLDDLVDEMVDRMMDFDPRHRASYRASDNRLPDSGGSSLATL
jgi:AcrR family transcriptional regulator